MAKLNTKKKPKLIALFIIDEFQALDLFGPLDCFTTANEIQNNAYDIHVCSFSKKPVKTETGIEVIPTSELKSLSNIDTLILCGGRGSRAKNLSTNQHQSLKKIAKQARRVSSVCTGAYLLASLQLKDKLTLATHWEHTQELQASYPDIKVDANSIYIKQDNIWSSAGITAGIDLALAMIAEDYGETIAKTAAKKLVVYLCRTGNQAQFSKALKSQSQSIKNSNERFQALLQWLPSNLQENLSLDSIADRLSVSKRHLSRLFREEFSCSPAKYVESLRLDLALELLSKRKMSISEIATNIGFKSTDSFRRAFERKFSTSPSLYRNQFSKVKSQ